MITFCELVFAFISCLAVTVVLIEQVIDRRFRKGKEEFGSKPMGRRVSGLSISLNCTAEKVKTLLKFIRNVNTVVSRFYFRRSMLLSAAPGETEALIQGPINM